MEEMGLFTYNKHGIQVASRELGKRAATLFADAIGANVAKLLKKKIADASVSVRDLERSEEHTSELQSLMRISYAVFCLKKKSTTQYNIEQIHLHYKVTSTSIKNHALNTNIIKQ